MSMPKFTTFVANLTTLLALVGASKEIKREPNGPLVSP